MLLLLFLCCIVFSTCKCTILYDFPSVAQMIYIFKIGCNFVVLDVVRMSVNVHASVVPLLLLPVALEGQLW